VLGAAFYMSVRFAIALALLAVVMPGLFRGLTREHWRLGAYVGLSFAAGSILQIVALNEIPASRSSFLTSLAVVFTPLLMVTVERRWPRPVVLAGVALALAGTAVLTGIVELGGRFGLRTAGEAATRWQLGDTLTTIAAFLFAVQIIQVDLFSRRMPTAQLTPGMFVATMSFGVVTFAAGVIAMPSSTALPARLTLLQDGSFMTLTVVTSLLCTVAAFYLMNKYQPFVTPADAALIYTLEPIFATFWAMWLPGLISPLVGLDYPSEEPGWQLTAGGLLVVAGNVLALWPTGTSSTTMSALPPALEEMND
jgi:drug/metabolite transporter (DMT)-like permease